MSTSRTLLLGGTFDPVHNGHLVVARAAAEAIGCSKVILIPNAQSPHKQGLTSQTPALHRLNLLKAAITGDTFFDILTLELERTPPSYTYDTIEYLFKQGWQEVNWLIGADQAMKLPEWHRAADLVQRVKFHVAARPGYMCTFDSLPRPFSNLRNSIVITPEIQISATDIRARVKAGKSIRYLVPEGVENYIREQGLYRI